MFVILASWYWRATFQGWHLQSQTFLKAHTAVLHLALPVRSVCLITTHHLLKTHKSALLPSHRNLYAACSLVHWVEWNDKEFQQQHFLTCHSKKNTGVNNWYLIYLAPSVSGSCWISNEQCNGLKSHSLQAKVKKKWSKINLKHDQSWRKG